MRGWPRKSFKVPRAHQITQHTISSKIKQLHVFIPRISTIPTDLSFGLTSQRGSILPPLFAMQDIIDNWLLFNFRLFQWLVLYCVLYNWISNQIFHMSTQWDKHIQKPCQNKGPHHLFEVSEYFSVKDISHM